MERLKVNSLINEDNLTSPGLAESNSIGQLDNTCMTWAPLSFYLKTLDLSWTLRNRLKGLLTIPGKDSLGRDTVLYKNSDVLAAMSDIITKPKVSRDTGKYVDQDREEWASLRWFVSVLTLHETYLIPRLGNIRCIDGRNRSGRITKLYNVTDMLSEFKSVSSLPKTPRETGVYTDHLQGEWASLRWFVRPGITRDILPGLLKNLEIKLGRGKNGHATNLYKIADVEKRIEEYLNKPQVVDNEQVKAGDHEDGLVGYRHMGWLIEHFGMSRDGLLSLLEGIEHVDGKSRGKVLTFYNFNEAEKIISDFLSKPRVDRKNGGYVGQDGLAWETITNLSKKMGIASVTLVTKIESQGNVRRIEGRDKSGRIAILYNAQDVKEALGNFIDKPQTNRTTGIYTNEEGEEWAAIGTLSNRYNLSIAAIRERLMGVRFLEGRDRVGKEVLLYNIAEAENVLCRLVSRPQTDRNTREYLDPAGESWASLGALKDKFGVYEQTILSCIRRAEVTRVRNIEGRDGGGHSVLLYNISDIRKLLETRQNQTISPEKAFLEEYTQLLESGQVMSFEEFTITKGVQV